jgi:chorismate mutase
MPRQDDAQLRELRLSIDNIDAALVYLLAERFKITQKVGQHKKAKGLAPADPEREREQVARLCKLAKEAQLEPAFAEKFLNFILQEVIRNHERMREATQ